MNPYPYLTNARSSLIDEFYSLQTYARRDFLFAKLMGKSTKLAIFAEHTPHKSPNRKYIGIQDIPVEQIVGTLNRQNDFDHKFRPLQSYLRDRWVNVCLMLSNHGWSPILVHKVGDQYYVEDGHHRVSVARSFGQPFIEAKIWEYPVQSTPAKRSKCAAGPERNPVEAYAAD